MNLQERINLLQKLGEYILADTPRQESWQSVKERAGQENGWFIKEFVDLAVYNIANTFLKKEVLEHWAGKYQLETNNPEPFTIGIIMAGNIPLVGFHDFLCVFISGHKARIKLSKKDTVLFKHLVDKMADWNAEVKKLITIEEMLKGCDAYITTGSNNSSRYFEYYFNKYPHIIRRNRTSVAVLDGTETMEELERLADDVHLFFGLGCRNVTKIYVPHDYDFVPLLSVFEKYHYFIDHFKYKNNFDYCLALQILNNKYYMTNGSIILVENESLFSPVSQLHYEYFSKKEDVMNKLADSQELQCIVGHHHIPFGKAQIPLLTDYADGVDTMEFISSLRKHPAV